MGFCLLALALPQPGQARGGAELPGFGVLLAGNVDDLMKAGFRFFFDLRLLQNQLPFQPIRLRLIEPLLGALDKCQRLGHRPEPILHLLVFPLCLGE